MGSNPIDHPLGKIPKWTNGAVCKTVVRGFESRSCLMSIYTADFQSFGRVLTGGPKKWDEEFWKSYEEFLKILREACPPDALNRLVEKLINGASKA